MFGQEPVHVPPPGTFGGDEATGGPTAERQASGFPSPARDYFHGGIDLNRHLIRDRTSTFIMRVAGNSMAASGICDGDEVIVDRSLPVRDGRVVIAVLEAEMVIRRLGIDADGVWLRTDDPATGPVMVRALEDLTVWGVVTRCLHHV
ncbi:MAG: LexA family protein [Arthrobacter sp.]|uniref:LexA family protein n=1 Tax=Arthrobacter sp. 179 TaxID=3457734 RepID=UPI00264D1117|nr:translesion error-prone DNA polymerase V autoproteolytic subunit [Micrococcaceae bacterium]MDN5825080.1 translesion error-prone DNA polymerase V autoproteolytic subunit [Micrococcaceae bacterium]MDN5887484.1 translesion error-prone DNA polymerase V autoproteolytic subunit [Micrococcaceae bacterium]MDN6169373.1 translesion error-prone DNA polymerase V autoproteolytic subunit [Micrococcaceae bacterium]MDN6178607.1 translesion error-prone DNA polymerase V autoproteolytic subunit [Micrococcaceae